MRPKFHSVILSLTILAIAVRVSGAATHTVTSTADSGAGSLRDAISAAAPGDTINFSLSLPAFIGLTGGPLVINTDLTIIGPGASSLTIDASSNSSMARAFTIASGFTVSISGLTVTGGRGRGTQGGAADDSGGAIFNSGTLALSDAVISNSSVRNQGIGGGGIFNAGGATLTLTNCTVSGNRAGGDVIQNAVTGGGIRNANGGNLTLTNTTVANNTAHVGGGIWNNGMLTVAGSTFSGNSAGVGISTPDTLEGGGIYVLAANGTGAIINSTFFQNGAKDDGAAIANGGTLEVTNSTFSGNLNQAGGGGAVSAIGNGQTLTLIGTILDNAAGNCNENGGVLASGGYNLSTDVSCSFSSTGDLASTPAGLDPFGPQFNGGPTKTIALLSTSPAKDAIPIASCTVATDQRGVVRPQGADCDIGSFELVGNPPTISSFTPTSGGVGALVTITGTGFDGASAVAFNGTSDPSFTVNFDTQITATVPTGATTGPIAVTAPGGTANSSTNFTVIPAPTISDFTPASGVVGSSVTITGTNFTDASAVTFSGTSSSYSVNSATQITATVPSGAATGPIAVTTPGGTATSVTNFTVLLPPPPTITSFSPQSGGVGKAVTINGTNFSGATGVTFGGAAAQFTVSNSNKRISASVPLGATTGPIVVTTPNGTATSATAFTVIPTPTISDFDPASGPSGTVVTISGTDFTGATVVMFDGKSASFTLNSPTQIAATVPAKGLKAGLVTISVTTPGGTATSATTFEVIK